MPESASSRRDRQERFSEQLRKLRAEAGNPSFRVMAARSRVVSHATLHEAAKGTRFPSWPTTEAFVEACGGDVAEWRKRWSEAFGDPETPTPPPATSEAPETAAQPDAEGAVMPAVPVPVSVPAVILVPAPAQGRARRTGRGVVFVAAALGALLAAAVVFAYVNLPHGAKPVPSREAQGEPALQLPDMTPTEPRFPGDQSVFVADVTIPDGTVVKPGERFTKTWEIANVGTVAWRDRFLERAPLPADNGTCSTPGKVRIPDTAPGAHVRISVPVMAPGSPGSCWVGWKMVDGAGVPYLPGSRPIYFVVNVAG
ncbi:hypothetical protein Pth03_60580 [Planotetraspora thailandica]|uniref:Nbr1 FW domain-containing protein n=1 Tax=Planotetraspora thailandica TaxID=487172 RepID=A0A8J3V4K2_9ACTN|nr:NBR1-Ig-like domain-containing protein [Planotetraspora thailandica]GII57669.1 hypothetical protein Pth03_60580 [Planotetraspora thailandica]